MYPKYILWGSSIFGGFKHNVMKAFFFITEYDQDNASISPPLIVDASSFDMTDYIPQTMMTSIADIENSTNFNSFPVTCDTNSNYNVLSNFSDKSTQYFQNLRYRFILQLKIISSLQKLSVF